jgi:hypothetical protein
MRQGGTPLQRPCVAGQRKAQGEVDQRDEAVDRERREGGVASVSGTLSHITAARKIAVSARSPAVSSRITLPRMLMGQAIRKINWAESTFIAPISWNLAVTNAEAMAATDGTSDQPAQFRNVERLGDGEEALMV